MMRSVCLAAMTGLYVLTGTAGQPGSPSWVDRSNENAGILLEVMARFNPETAGQLGVDGYDDQTIDLRPDLDQRSRAATGEALTVLRERLEAESDPAVLQDLAILIEAAEDDIRGTDLYAAYQLPYYNVARIAFSGIRSLLDDQIPPERRTAALVRLQRYAGTTPGTMPIATLARQRISEKIENKDLKGPVRAEVEKDLSDAGFFVSGIESLFTKYGITG
ncbi:MAG: DUF885 domain-containing protein, partial [Ignavibacteria bacterium]|nr:DUF885 domain-containing protein [Ignavibacteria bacterium]